MSLVPRFLQVSVVAGALLVSATHATAVAPKVTVSVEPFEAGQIVYMLLAAESSSAKQKGQMSLLFSVLNQEGRQITLNKVTAAFTGPPTVATATFTLKEKVPINAGATGSWNHENDKNVILPFPAPKSVTLSLYFDGFTDPATITRNLAPHRSPVTGGAYLFPAKITDLRFNEYWTARSGHATGNFGSQLFGYDMGVIGYDEGRKAWTDLLPGTTGDKNSDYRIWGKPIYAMAAGTVLEAVDTVPQNPRPIKFRNKAELDQKAKEQEDKYWGNGRFLHGGSGNHFYLQHGDEVMLYAHMQTGSLNKKLMAAGAKVKAGEFLGLAGNSGSSSAPHLHIHAVQGNMPENGTLRPLPFRNIQVVARHVPFSREPTGPWVSVTGAGLPNVDTNIWPAATKPTWYPPGWYEVSKHGISNSRYQTEFDRMASSGYRPVWIDGYSVDGKAFYNVIFRPDNGKEWIARHGLTGTQYEAEFQKHTKAGFKLTHVDCYDTDSGLHYAAIFSKAVGPDFIAYHGRDSGEHQKQFDKLTKEGWYPTVISVASSGGKLRHAAIYVKANYGALWARPSMTQTEYQKEFNDGVKAGRELVYINAYRHAGKVYFSGIWYSKSGGSGATHHGLNIQQYQDEFDRQHAQGMLTRAVTGYESNDSHHFAAIWKK